MHRKDGDQLPPPTPSVIRNADKIFRTTARPVGYSPALGVQMARAHCWAPYESVASALRSLALKGGLEDLGDHSRDAARENLRDLFEHQPPFGAKAQFPQGKVFVCVDSGALGQCVYRMLAELQRVEAAAAGTRGQQHHQMVDACEAFMKAVASAAAALERPDVLYDRYRFEEAFGMTWTAKP